MKHALRNALGAAALTLAFCAPSMAQEPIKIGFVGTLSGPTAAVGQEQLDGFKLFLDANGGKLGGVPIELLQEDSQMKPDTARQVVRSLVEREKVPIITGVSFSNEMLAIHKYITDKEVFLRSEEHTSELQSREISYAVVCLKKKI